ncbi:MAG: V4R domain-containing protein [Eubacteriales bacterium]|jgi:predicted hydrocarbon binding protein
MYIDRKTYEGLDNLKKANELLSQFLPIGKDTYEDMSKVIDRNPELVDKLRECYTLYNNKQPIRPMLGNEMQILYMRERQTITALLFPELLKMQYEVARIIGEKFIAPYLTGKTLPEIMLSNQPIAEQHGYAIQEIVECGEDFAIYRHYECADCYGLPNIGMKICAYEAGTAAGCFELPLGKRVEVTEVKCCANGDPYCEFEVRVIE